MRTDVLEAEPATHDHASRTEHPDTSTGYRTTHTHTRTNARMHTRTQVRTHAHTHTHTTEPAENRTPKHKGHTNTHKRLGFHELKQKQGPFGLGLIGCQGGFVGCLVGFGVLVRGLEVEGANANVVRKQEQGSRAVCSWGPRAASGRWLWELCLTEGSCPVDHCPNSSGLRLTGSRRRI